VIPAIVAAKVTVRDSVAVVATALLPAAVLRVPVVGTVLLPDLTLLALLFALLLLRSVDLLGAVLVLSLLLLLRTLLILRILSALLLGRSLVLLILLPLRLLRMLLLLSRSVLVLTLLPPCSLLIILALVLRLLGILLLLVRTSLFLFLLRFLGVTRNTCTEKYQQRRCCDQSLNSCHGDYLIAHSSEFVRAGRDSNKHLARLLGVKRCCLALHSSDQYAAAFAAGNHPLRAYRQGRIIFYERAVTCQ
jgi:hypothetical protein